MKIGKNLRNLVMRQSETYMISPRQCIYITEKYEFEPVTRDEFLAAGDAILKLLDERSWVKRLMDRLFKENQ